MIKLIIFDFDGTIFDTKKDIAISVNILLKENNLKELPLKLIYKNIGRGAEFLIKKSFENFGIEPPKDSYFRFLEIYETQKLKNTKPFDGIVEIIEKLCFDKILYIITNKDEKSTIEILKYFNLDKYFKKVIGRDTFGIKKPDKRLIDYVKKNENVDEKEILIIGDSEIDIIFGKENNIKVIVVSWGGISDLEEIKKLNPDFIVEKPIQIYELISKNFV